jgi:hypothetical protein
MFLCHPTDDSLRILYCLQNSNGRNTAHILVTSAAVIRGGPRSSKYDDHSDMILASRLSGGFR